MDKLDQTHIPMLRVIAFHETLREMMTNNDTHHWPNANWIYEQLTEAIYGDSEDASTSTSSDPVRVPK